MRAAFVLGLVAVLFPAAAGAQSDRVESAASGGASRKRNMSNRRSNARPSASSKLDTNHDGVLSPDERKSRAPEEIVAGVARPG